jgi:hypothetical protein
LLVLLVPPQSDPGVKLFPLRNPTDNRLVSDNLLIVESGDRQAAILAEQSEIEDGRSGTVIEINGTMKAEGARTLKAVTLHLA